MTLHVVDLAQKGMAPGELRKVAARVGGMEALIDREGKRYVERGLKCAAPTGPLVEEALVDEATTSSPRREDDAIGGSTVGATSGVW